MKDQTRIYLAAGNKTAYVNDQPIELDVAPVIYAKKQRTYIPLRFVAEVLNKKVVWEGSAKAIYICDLIKYKEIKDILSKVDEAMKLAEKCSQMIDIDTAVKSGQMTMNIDINAEAQIDKAQKRMNIKMCINMLGLEMKSDTYYADNTSYILDILTQKWQKKNYMPSEYDSLFASQSDIAVMKVNESLCAGLVRVEGTNPEEIVLKGDAFLIDMFNRVLASQEIENPITSVKNVEFGTFQIEASINSTTNLISSISMNVAIIQTDNKNETIKTDIGIKILYSDYNGNFQIVVPEEILLNAVETTATEAPVITE